jgi:hypothetical protein
VLFSDFDNCQSVATMGTCQCCDICRKDCILHVLHVREIVTFFILAMHSSDRLNAFYFAAQPIIVHIVCMHG